MILSLVKMTGCRNAKLAAFSVANENYGRLHLFWKPTKTAGSRIAAAPIKPGISNLLLWLRLLAGA
jgi:hypothetical protein